MDSGKINSLFNNANANANNINVNVNNANKCV